ncbi:MAG: hypothetical protein PF572_04690, partial [Patescibacteria group bacterium]|nr:hypothetical protein [Patescibacteria group bacterium]
MQKYLFTIILLFFVNINFVLAYNNTIVHPGITNEAIKLYLRSGNEGKITSKQSASILKGAENEDIDPRYLNHFYNPYNNQSLEVLGATFSTAKEWAFKQNSETGDYSVSTILDNYREGNTKRAFEGIGHILHLVQDMGTPAHVRVDPHPPWEPDGLELATEEYAKYPFVDAKYSKKEIGNIFDEFAKYTIDNFYSNDRIDNNIILTDFTTREEADGKIHTYGVKDDHIVCHIKKAGEGKKCELIDFVYKYYWQELHPKTVTYSASTIDWFMDEFEKIDEENEKLSFWDKVSNKIVSLPSAIWKSRNYVWGDTYLATRDSAISNIRGVFLGAVDVSYYSGIAFDVGIRSTSEIVKEGSIGTLESMGEASLLAGAGIEKTFDFSVGVGEKTVSLIKEGVAETNEVIVGLPKVLGLESEEFVLEQEHTPSADTDTPLPPEADRQERGIEEGGWVPRTNILLFTGGSSGSDDDGSV